MGAFHKSVNWLIWYEEWHSEIDSSGFYRYKKIYDFARAKAKSKEQLEFLMWYLGPNVATDNSKYPFVDGPMDWKEKRESGGWYTDKALKEASKQIAAKMDSLEAVREGGNGAILWSLTRTQRLAQKLDEAFQGKFLVDGLDFAKTVERARAYLILHKQILSMQAQAFDLWAKANGINYESPQGLGELIAASAIAAHRQGEVKEKTRVELAMEKLWEMSINKAAKYDLELPKEAVEAISEATVEPPKKKSVQ